MKNLSSLKAFEKSSAQPVPVQLKDDRGNPVQLGGGMSAGGGGNSVIINDNAHPVPVTIVSGSGSTSATNIVDSSGVGYSGSNPVPATIVSGAGSSTITVGPTVGGAADDGSAPVQQGGVARTTLPTKMADGQVVKAMRDAIGRNVMRNVQVRELIVTAYASLTNGTETTLATASAGQFLDSIWIACANTSSAAQQIDIRAVSGGNIVHSIEVPANGTAGWAPPVPWPQDFTGNAWTADNADVTNSTVYVHALFSKEV